MRDQNISRAAEIAVTAVPVASALAMFESAAIAVRHALSLPYSDRALLEIALNLTSSLTLLSQGMDRRQLPHGSAQISAEALSAAFEPYSQSLDDAWATLQTYRGDGGWQLAGVKSAPVKDRG